MPNGRRALATILLLACGVAVSAQRIEWVGDLAEAEARSLDTGRPVFVVVTAGAWCDPCGWFEESTLTDPDLVAVVENSYVPFRVNDSDTAAASFVIDRVPSVYVIYPGEEVPAFTTSGPVSADALVVQLRRLAPASVQPASTGEKRYLYNGGDIFLSNGRWISRDAGLPPEFEQYESDDDYYYLRNVDAGVLLAIPRSSGGVWRWDRETREWVTAGEAELLPE